MRKNIPGYPLPVGELGEDEIVCQLVYLPDRPEYWQALLAGIHYFSTWRAWERDADKRGRDAAANWRDAFELTMECWRMTCLDDITDRMDVMIDLLGNQMSCCGTTTIGPIIIVTTIITPGVGDDPAVWGETAVSDWDEWLEYVCYHAHVYVDSLIEGAKAIDIAIELGSYTIDFFVGVMRFMQYLGLDQVLGLNQVMMVYDAFRSEADLSGWFTPLADKFEDARQDIVCSILQGGSLSDAVEDAVDDNAVWLLFYVLTDFDAVQALMYEATADGVEYLPPIKRDDCDCITPAMFTYTFDGPSAMGWPMPTGLSYTLIQGGIAYNMSTDQSEITERTDEDGDAVVARFTISDPVIINRLRFKFMFFSNGQTMGTWYFYLQVIDQDTTVFTSAQFHTSGYAEDEWHEVDWDLGQDVELRHSSSCFGGRFRRYQAASGGQRIILDDIEGVYE
ncbi:MAG: hypothetical protein KAJ55_17500 [Anaerolineales bacterium]|nr:hypothetical protein [Anaerolineales bacterium]